MCKVTAHFCDVSYFTYVKFLPFPKKKSTCQIIKIATSFCVFNPLPQKILVLEIGREGLKWCIKYSSLTGVSSLLG